MDDIKFSIIIPTYNNLYSLKICLHSIERNSSINHEIIIHCNDGSDGTLDFIKKKKYKYSFSKNNLGLCSSVNVATELSTTDYILYSHDDMYFCPSWDKAIYKELKSINTDKFYLSAGTTIEPSVKNFGNPTNFNEAALLNFSKEYEFYDYQGSHWAPHLIKKKIWRDIGGFSEEFNPGFGSDPDLNMKLWIRGVRIFKGLKDFKIYHFGSQVLRSNKIKKNKSSYIFLMKWGITINFFKKYYLKSNLKYNGPLRDPKKNIFFYIDFVICKIKLLYVLSRFKNLK